MKNKIDQKNFHVIMGKNVVNIGHHYFHNVDMSEANIHIMKIMLTEIHDHYFHNVVKIFLVCTRFHNEKSLPVRQIT